MPTLPWRWTGTTRPDHTLLFVSRFDAHGLKSRGLLFTAGSQLRKVVLDSPGALGVSLRAQPIAGRFYTLTMWQDEASLMAFAHSAEHRAAVGRLHRLGPVTGVLVSRDWDGSQPRWREVVRWVSTVEPGPYHHVGLTGLTT